MPDPAPLPARWLAIVNPVAGRGRARKLLPELSAAFERAPVEVDLVVSAHADHPAELARAALRDGHGVVACGGDGLIAELGGLVAEANGTLGIVPTGSGNDLARHLGFDLDEPLAAVDVLANGTVRAIDLGRVDGRWFATVAGSGFDAEANRWANGVHRLRGTTLYVTAVLRTLATYRPHRFRITIDDREPREIRAWLVAMANGSSYGGGMRVAPEARIDDGLLDVVHVGPIGRFRFLRSFPRVFKGTHLDVPEVELARARRIRIESLEASIPMELYASGERIGALPAEVEVVPAALRIVCP